MSVECVLDGEPVKLPPYNSSSVLSYTFLEVLVRQKHSWAVKRRVCFGVVCSQSFSSCSFLFCLGFHGRSARKSLLGRRRSSVGRRLSGFGGYNPNTDQVTMGNLEVMCTRLYVVGDKHRLSSIFRRFFSFRVKVNPCRAPKLLPILIPSNMSPNTGFQLYTR